MCEMNVTKEELNVIIGRLQDAINVCHTAPENKDEGWPYACLLYTSPSPRDQRGSRMPSSA